MTSADLHNSQAPWCSIITVTFNSARTLRHFWSQVDLTSGVEWVVVDNASTDDTVLVARELGARVVQLEKNHGFSYANNVGYSVAESDFIAFLNPDVRPDQNALRILERAANENDAIVGPQLYNSDGTRQPNGRGFPTLAVKIRNRLRADDSQYLLYASGDAPRNVVWLMGAAVLGYRAQFDQFGAWDPRFFLYYEDSDLGLRSWRAGVPVMLIPRARMLHGWARETAGKFRLTPWLREIPSMIKFYWRYPRLLTNRNYAKRAHPRVTGAVFDT
ncbi:glycosyltransferase [Microbacterium sp. YJN-G]|uniref:glycosyltransferase n=1 Tax=Microbacterium sp. YJN-G TaxID=2763257 RepID=UPI0018786D7A|nr:glycosyltransferase [Microbacterium sp. YJN-G]